MLYYVLLIIGVIINTYLLLSEDTTNKICGGIGTMIAMISVFMKFGIL